MSNNIEDQINYAYRNILTLHFELSEYPYDIKDLLNNLNLNFSSVFKSNLEDKALFFDIEIEAQAELEEVMTCFSVKLRNVFVIPEIENYKSSKENIALPKQFLVILASVSYSSARGILHEKLAFSRYQPEFILPVIKPDMLIEGMDFENIEPIGQANTEENG